MQNDKKFWSEQASSRTYWGNTSILNSNALYAGQDSTLLSHFRSGSLENMYFAVYNTDVLQQQNLMSKNEDGDILSVGNESRYTYARLYNNYRLAHFYRNGYSATAYKLQEYAAVSDFIDPSVNMPLPMGLATPDRKGFALSGDASWNDAVDFNLRLGSYTWDAIDDRFTQLGMGLGVDIAQLINYDMPLKLQGSFESASENKYLKRKTTRIVGGATIGIWGPISALAGVQMLNKTYDGGLDLYGDASVTVKKVEEMLILAGPQVKLGPGAYLNVEGGYMTNDVSYASAAVAGTQKLSIDKTLIMANVSVLF